MGCGPTVEEPWLSLSCSAAISVFSNVSHRDQMIPATCSCEGLLAFFTVLLAARARYGKLVEISSRLENEENKDKPFDLCITALRKYNENSLINTRLIAITGEINSQA